MAPAPHRHTAAAAGPPDAGRLARALAASQDGHWERNLRTGETWFSDSFLARFGPASGELSGTRSVRADRVHPDDRSHLLAAFDEALRSRGRFDVEVRFLDASQRWRWVRGRGQVWVDETGEPVSIGGVVSDVHRGKTVLRQLEQTRMALEALVRERTAGLQAALTLAEQRHEEAERANAAKTRFLAHMSHEVRTPLHGVLGLVDLALRSAVDPAQQRQLQVARQSGLALQQVINDVLDYSRLEAGRRELPSAPFDMALALAEVMRALMPLARQRDLVMMYDWEGEPSWVMGNESAVRQIVTNLLGNAIKFTEVGHVALRTVARPDGPGRLSLAVGVTDTGPGISPDLQQQVFEAFRQGDDRLARSHGGTGLGLTIARSLADALGGSLHLACPAAGGCQFTLRLGLPRAAAPQAVPAAQRAGRKVWLVYHRQAPGDWLARRLERLGWQVTVRVGLDAALALSREPGHPPPDLVMLGEPVLQPGIDLAALRRALPAVPMRLLIRPDWHAPKLEALARSLDMQPLMAPLTPDMLAALGAPRDAPAPPRPPGPATSAMPAAPTVGRGAEPLSAPADRAASASAEVASAPPASPLRAGAEVLLVEDNAVNQMVAEAFLQALGLQVRLAADGQAALAACLERAPALVLMDLQMPGMDGLEAAARLQALRREGRWPGAPIVALTAHAGEADRDACLAAGMSGVMTKPFSLDSLQRQLARWLPA